MSSFPFLLTKYDLANFVGNFNSEQDSIRVIEIASPTCRDCLRGHEIVRNIFARFDSKKLRGLVVWTRKLELDTEDAAKSIAEMTREDSRFTHFWDENKAAGLLFGNLLRLEKQQKMMAEIYMLYAPRVKWESEENPPEPVFSIHQPMSDRSVDQSRVLDLALLGDETKFLLEAEDPELADQGITEVLLGKRKDPKTENRHE